MDGASYLKKGAISILLLCVILLWAEWVPFGTEQIPKKTSIELLSANETSVQLNIKIFGAEVSEYDANKLTYTGKEVFALLKIDEYAFIGEIGKPKLPMVTSVLDVPHKANIKVEVISAESQEIDLRTLGIDKRIAPALPSVIKKPNVKAEFIIDEKTYSTDAFYPDKIADIYEGDGGLARGHRLATLRVYPIHYNPVSGRIRVYTDIRLKVDFVDGDILETQRVIAKDFSPVWEEFIRRTVINYPEYLRGVPPLPVYYDIFYNGQAQTVANKLAQWKKKKGYKIRMWNAAGWTASAINDTIRTRNPLATFLVIIGDPNSSSIALPPSATGSSSGDQTDLYYAEVNEGNTYLPDMFYARISVLDTVQGNTSVKKAIDWEHANFGSAGTSWLKKACLIAGYDAGYQPVGIGTNAWCRALLLNYGYQVDTLIISSSESDQRIKNQINAGRVWCVYTAHGSQTSWAINSVDQFTVTELGQLTNNNMYPMPAGHCCLSGDYQYSSDCFGETWDRLSGKGGICYFGSVPSTYWDEDDWLQRRYFDAIYTDSVTGRLYETGRFTQWGLYWIENHTSSSLKRYYFEAYHLFNDPSLDFWTDIPQNLVVSHNTVVFPGSQQFTVTVTGGGNPLRDALVCCWIKTQNPEVHVSAYTNASGVAVLNINPTTPGDTMYVTVTKHNYLPYEGYAMVTNPSGPYVVLGRTIINDSGGNGQVNPGETVNYGVYAKNVGVATAQGVYGKLAESDPYVSISIDSSWYGSIPANDSVLGNPYYRFSVANNCPNNYSVTFTLTFRDASNNTWTANPIVTVYAPVLIYQSVAVTGGNNNGILDPNETANLVVTIRNDGGAVASNIVGVLMENSPWITINDGNGSWGTLNPGATGSNSSDVFTVTAGNAPIGTPVTFQVQLTSGVYCDTIDFEITIGRMMPSDTGYYYVYWSGGPYQQAPVYSWFAIDTTQTVNPGTSLNLSDDQVRRVGLPFTFKYYGLNYNRISISSNGFVTLDSATSS
ncbi:MAG: C25 family cysteine peptidase, partial [candidate division WOR-3 bacterium]